MIAESREQWTAWEREEAARLKSEGQSYKQIGRRFDRSPEGVRKVVTRPVGAQRKWR